MEAQKKLKGKADCVEAAVAAETETNKHNQKEKTRKVSFFLLQFLRRKVVWQA